MLQIGGMLFVMELSTRWRPELTWRTFFACAVTAYAIASCVGDCSRDAASVQRCAFYTSGGLLSVPGFDFSSRLRDGIPVALLGALGGVLGALFNKLNVTVRRPP